MRVIGRLEIKDKFVIKPIQYDGLRKVGNPEDIIADFYNSDFDEILILNITGSLYGIDWIKNFVASILKKTFIPVTIGGGIKNINQAKEFFDVGVDKVAVNTAIIEDFSLVDKLKREFGSQSVVCSIQANKINNEWYGFTDMARNNSFKRVTDLIKKYSDSRVGEILLTSVRYDGTLKGVDEELLELCLKFAEVPVIYSGGVVLEDASKIADLGLEAVAVSSSFYYNNFSVLNFKQKLKAQK